MQCLDSKNVEERIDTVDSDLFTAIANNDQRKISQLFSEFNNIDLLSLTNSALENLLHIACQNSSENVINMIITYFEASSQRTMLKHFLDMRNKEGFSSIHLASFAGKLQAVEALHRKGADLTLKNVAGLTAMHTAAQGDQVAVMCYLKMHGLSIDQKDENGRTPLHWAAYQSANNAFAFLLAWDAKLEETDFDNKMTPLHYAVISGSTQIVRKLLLAGADRTPKDQEGRTPIDHAIEKQMETISSILSSKSGLAEACNLKQPFEKMRKKKRLLMIFGLIYFSSFFGSLFFVIPYVASIQIFVTFLTLSLVTIFFFFCTWLCDPGYLDKHKQNHTSLLSLLKQFPDPQKICAKCEIMQPKRSKHCEICNRCVKVYDHHCPWINNCVGANNFKYFYLFVVLTFLQLSFQLVLHSLCNDLVKNEFILLIFSFLTTDFASTIPVEKYVVNIFDNKETIEIFHLITSGYCTIISVFFLICVAVLLFVQTQNLAFGITTNEKFRNNKKQKQSIHDKQLDSINEEDATLNRNFINASESFATTIDPESSILTSSSMREETHGFWTNLLDMCIRNNNNPLYNIDYIQYIKEE